MSDTTKTDADAPTEKRGLLAGLPSVVRWPIQVIALIALFFVVRTITYLLLLD